MFFFFIFSFLKIVSIILIGKVDSVLDVLFKITRCIKNLCLYILPYLLELQKRRVQKI